MKIEIEKNIPLTSGKPGPPIKYPFAQMKVGDSFFVPDVPKSFTIYSMVRNFNEKNKRPIKVTQRRESNGVRVWRIA